jgi:hypothetical protein
MANDMAISWQIEIADNNRSSALTATAHQRSVYAILAIRKSNDLLV